MKSGLIICILGIINATITTTAFAAWPTDKPITFLIPYAAGGATDVQARFLAERLGQKINQSVVSINKPGAGTTIATMEALRNPADGYTLLMGSITSHGIAPTLYRETAKYDAVRDFSPIVLISSIPNVLLVNPKLPINTVDELIAYARKKPGGLNYASAGYGATSHLAPILLQQRLGLDMTHVPYSGGAPAITALISGVVDIYFDQLSSALPFIQSKQVKALAVTSPKSSINAPDIQPISVASKETALKDFTISAWWGVYVKTGTSPEIINKLNQAFNEIIFENKDYFQKNGITAEGGKPEDLAKLTTDEVTRWSKIVLDLGLKPN